MSVAPTTKAFLSVAEASAYLNIGRSLTYRLIGSGEIKTIKVGARRLNPVEALDAYIERLKN